MMLVKIVLWSLMTILIGVPVYALPATMSLRPGTRPGVEQLTIHEAAQALKDTGLTDWELVEAARALVGERMQYSRRNSFDSPRRAFERGYGYCMQHAYALSTLLEELGFEARVVQAFQNKFPDGKVTSHAWVSVSLDGESRYTDPLFYDEDAGMIDFIPLSKVTGISPFFKIFTFWGGTGVNAYRYYLTGKDL